MTWSHDEEELLHFLNCLSSVHPRIQFTMEKGGDDKLSFLDVLAFRRSDGGLSHRVYHKLMHTDSYLLCDLNHHPSQKCAVVKLLVD